MPSRFIAELNPVVHGGGESDLGLPLLAEKSRPQACEVPLIEAARWGASVAAHPRQLSSRHDASSPACYVMTAPEASRAARDE